MESIDSKIAKMGSDITHLKESFDELKEDTKEFHQQQTEMLDELKTEWQKFGGVVQGFTSIQIQVNEHEKFISEYKHPIKEMVEDKKDNKKRLRDLAWKWGAILLIFVVTMYVLFTASQAMQGLSQALQNGPTLTDN